ncbi:hypothetical protein FKM82_024636 [Ascaphus truei]
MPDISETNSKSVSGHVCLAHPPPTQCWYCCFPFSEYPQVIVFHHNVSLFYLIPNQLLLTCPPLSIFGGQHFHPSLVFQHPSPNYT